VAHILAHHKPEEAGRSSVEGQLDHVRMVLGDSTLLAMVGRIVLVVAEEPSTITCQFNPMMRRSYAYSVISHRRQTLLHSSLSMEISTNKEDQETQDDQAGNYPFYDEGSLFQSA